jgi:hypothetical protein
MNTVKCKDCRHYDVIRSGQSSNPKHGWCAAKSIYPMKEEVGGPLFPPGVARRDRPDVVTNCTKVSPK